MSKLSKLLYFMAVISLGALFIFYVIIQAWVPFMWVPIGLSLGSIVGAFWSDRRLLIEFFTVKTTKSGLSMGMMIILALGLLVAVNFIGAKKVKSFDFSQAQINSLSEQSIKVVKDLAGDVKVLYFYKTGSEGVEERKRAFLDLVQKYQDQSSRIQLELVDMNARPDLTAQYNVSSGVETAWLEYAGRKSKLEKVDEQELTSAFIKVTREKEKIVYFSTGHGEFPFENSKDGLSMTALKSLLEGNRFAVRSHSFAASNIIPADADMFWILGPTQGFLDFEINSIRDFVQKGGQLIVAVDPKQPHKLEAFLKDFGLGLRNNYVATAVQTPMGIQVDPRAVRGNVFGTHPITKPFGRDQTTVFVMPQSIETAATAPAGIVFEDLVKTNAQAMAFPELKFDRQGDQGPFKLAVVAKGKGSVAETAKTDVAKASTDASSGEKEFTIVLFGGAAQFSDQLLYQNLNRDLALNTVSFLAKEESLISISPKDVTKTELKLTQAQFLIFLLGFIIPLPILLFGTSGFFWWRRRNA